MKNVLATLTAPAALVALLCPGCSADPPNPAKTPTGAAAGTASPNQSNPVSQEPTMQTVTATRVARVGRRGADGLIRSLDGGSGDVHVVVKEEQTEVLGGVAEWSMAAVLKTAVPVTVPGVRIPSPPLGFSRIRECFRGGRPTCAVLRGCNHGGPDLPSLDPTSGKLLASGCLNRGSLRSWGRSPRSEATHLRMSTAIATEGSMGTEHSAEARVRSRRLVPSYGPSRWDYARAPKVVAAKLQSQSWPSTRFIAVLACNHTSNAMHGSHISLIRERWTALNAAV
jgi:hypothetical protein